MTSKFKIFKSSALVVATIAAFSSCATELNQHSSHALVDKASVSAASNSSLTQRVTPSCSSSELCSQEVTQNYFPIVGNWIGAIPMSDHSHPLQLDFTVEDNQILFRYNFMGMSTRKNRAKSSQYFAADTFLKELAVTIPEEGISIKNFTYSENKLLADVYWMGRTFNIAFEKKVDKDTQYRQKYSLQEKMNVAILLFDNIDVLDWSGPLEVMTHSHAFNVYTVAKTLEPIDGGAYKVIPDFTLNTMPEADIVIVPGGNVAPLFTDTDLMSWIKEQSQSTDYLMSVCNASTLLAAAGALTDLKATTHRSWLPWLDSMSQDYNFDIDQNARFVDNGKIITTAGVSSGIDGALHLVAKIKGVKHAQMTANMLEYDWKPSAAYEF